MFHASTHFEVYHRPKIIASIRPIVSHYFFKLLQGSDTIPLQGQTVSIYLRILYGEEENLNAINTTS